MQSDQHVLPELTAKQAFHRGTGSVFITSARVAAIGSVLILR